MAGRKGWGHEARFVAAAAHNAGLGRRVPKYSGVTAERAKKSTQSHMASRQKLRNKSK